MSISPRSKRNKACEIAIDLIDKLVFKDDAGIKGKAPIPQQSLVPKFVVDLKVSIIHRFPTFNDRRDATTRGEVCNCNCCGRFSNNAPSPITKQRPPRNRSPGSAAPRRLILCDTTLVRIAV
jgi:hypothetical protein